MFEMLGLHDDALIQYDELDALFTQFVLNHASGGMSKMSKVLHLCVYRRSWRSCLKCWVSTMMH